MALRGVSLSISILRTAFNPIFLPACSHIPQRSYAKPVVSKKKLKMGPAAEKVRLPVETDPEKLVNFVCGSDPVKENPQDIKLKEDSEYPDWLWTLRMGKPPPLEEMDPNTKQYWRRLRTIAMKQKNLLKKAKRR